MMMEKPKPSSGSESPVVQQAQGGTATDDREAEIARRLAALGEAAVNNIEEKEEELEEEEEAPMEVEEEEEVEPEVIEVEEPEEMAAPEKPAEIPAPPVPAPAPAPVPVMEAKKPDPVPVVASPATNNKSALLVSHCMFSQLHGIWTANSVEFLSFYTQCIQHLNYSYSQLMNSDLFSIMNYRRELWRHKKGQNKHK
jgi:hypothetical protein